LQETSFVSIQKLSIKSFFKISKPSLKEKYGNLSDKNQKIIDRNYHTTPLNSLPDWLLGLGKLISLSGKTAPATHVIFPDPSYSNLDSTSYVKAIYKSIVSTIEDPMLWKFVLGVSAVILINAIVIVTEHKVSNIRELINFYNQIVTTPNMVDFLNASYPDLTDFNEISVKLLKDKSLNLLTYDQCLIIIKFCLYNKNLYDIWNSY